MPEATYNSPLRAWSAFAWTPVVAIAQVLKILASAPVVLFLLALTAMLFRPPELACSSLDRVAFVLMLVAFLLRSVLVRQPVRLERSAVWPLGALLVMSLASVATQPFEVKTWSVLAAKLIVPYALFHIARRSFQTESSRRALETFALLVLSYLCFIAVAFLFGARSLILPRFILDEGLSIHINRARGPFLQAVANGVTLNMVVSQTLRKYYDNRYGRESLCIPNGTHLRERRTPSHLSDWGLAPDDYILFLGRFSPEKNCHMLIDAYKRLDTSVKLVFAGGSSYTDAYVDQLRRHASDRIRFLPWVGGDELEELLTNAMLFALPSDMEGLSLALLDAMGAGVCVVTSDIPENRELVDGAGFTFRRGDVEDLERVLQMLVGDSAARRSAAAAAKQRIRDHYLWSDIACRIEAAYLKLTERHASEKRPTAA